MSSKYSMRNYPLIWCTILFTALSFFGFSQETATKPARDWFLLDPETDLVQGVSVEKAYASLLKGRPSKTIIVAIIDSGIDIDHEDLKSVIWTNPGEVAGNGIDEDKNGYVDDIHGWNFIGGKSGNVNEDNLELTRRYAKLEKRFGTIAANKVPRKQRKDYEEYQKVKDKFIRLSDKNKSEYDYFVKMNRNLKMSTDTLKAVLGVDRLTRATVDTFRASNPTRSFAKGFILYILRNSEDTDDMEKIQKDVTEAVDHYRVLVEYGYNTEYDSRQIVGDDPNNPREQYYGNNDVRGTESLHGTHVAGIVAADRTNDIGIKGICDNVRIMSVRAAPNGDERDKDVANAIRYAVDNGARVINMSFGKSYSPDKDVVDEAVAYAEKKGVLLIHASGNESNNNDEEGNFPSPRYRNGKEAANWIEVSASGAGNDKKLPADFSNYGKKTVDLFAPGVDIYSAAPENKYEEQSGTSMASPIVAGVAALLWSYFPDLTAPQVADIIKKSTRKFDGLKVKQPGGGEVMFDMLSRTGGVVNAYEAIALAIKLQSTRIE